MLNRNVLKWDGRYQLCSRSGRLLATIEPVREWPGLYRVRLADGTLTDVVNLTRARDAAQVLALEALNRRNAA
jgi:hypothetical protein